MDFQRLSRKGLQTLCKKNMIPANMTNVAMAEALAALQEVAGIEEFLNPIESESQQSEERIDIGTPGNCRTACRTSARRKPVKEPPTTQSIICTRRGRVGALADQENKDLNISSTPSFPSNRRRAPVPSARKKQETHSIKGKEEENDQNNRHQTRSDVLETPSMPKTQSKISVLGSTRRKTDARIDKSSVQGACSTRRSMRLLEKNMENLNLMECGNVEPVVANKLCDELPERKEFCEQKINEIDSKLNVFSIGGNAFEEDDSKEVLGLCIDESDEPEGKNETKDKEEEEQANNGKDGKESKEKVQMEDENEEDNTIADKEPQDKIQSEAAIKDQCEPENKIQSEAAIEEQHAFTPSCNDEISTENFSKEKDISAQSPLFRENADLDITVQHEVLKENSEIITEERVEFNIEDLVDDINVEEAEFKYVKVQDSISESPLLRQKADLDITVQHEVLKENSEIITEERVEFNIEDLVDDINVEEAEFKYVKVQDSISESPLLREKADLDITVQHEVLKENSEIITEERVEFNIEDLVDVNVEEAEFQYVKAQDSISEPKMEVEDGEVLKENSEIIPEERVEFNIEDLVDINVEEAEFQYVKAQDSISEPKMKVEDGESSFKIDVDVMESELVENLDSKDSVPESKIEDLSKSDEILDVNQVLPHEEVSEVIDNYSSFTPFAVDQIPGQFPRPTAEVPVKESRTSLEIFNSADKDEDIKNNSNDDEERNLSLRQLRKMIKELHLSKKSSKEKTYGKEQVEKVVRTALQPLSENCPAATTANSMFIN